MPFDDARKTAGARIGCLWPLIGLGFGLAAGVVLLGVGGVLRGPRLAGLPVAPIVVRLPAPTAAPTPTAPAILPPTDTPPPARSDGTFLAGDLVEVHGTEGDGVRLRSEPNLQAVILALGQDGEVYQILGGPVENSGYVWWQIARIDDAARQGWAVQTFLRLLQ